MKKGASAALLIGLAGMASPAQAEILRITSLYPAGDDAANLTTSLAVEPFLGKDGEDVSYAIERELERVFVEGKPYFEMLSYRARRDPDGLITGSADVSVVDSDTTSFERTCVEYDATKVFSGEEKEAKCTKRKMVEVKCDKRTITLEATIRLATSESLRGTFSEEYSRQNEQTSCPGENSFTSRKDEIKTLVKELAAEVRSTLAPEERTENIRVLEKRKGMDKAESRAFKAAVKMTKRDASEACRMWSEMADNGTAHLSLSFNLALCTEQSGDLSGALSQYRDAEMRFGDKSELSAGRRRIAAKMTAQDNWEERQGGASTTPNSPAKPTWGPG